VNADIDAGYRRSVMGVSVDVVFCVFIAAGLLLSAWLYGRGEANGWIMRDMNYPAYAIVICLSVAHDWKQRWVGVMRSRIPGGADAVPRVGPGRTWLDRLPAVRCWYWSSIATPCAMVVGVVATFAVTHLFDHVPDNRREVLELTVSGIVMLVLAAAVATVLRGVNRRCFLTARAALMAAELPQDPAVTG
jgi:hypothetical protein